MGRSPPTAVTRPPADTADVRVLWGVNGLALEATRDAIERLRDDTGYAANLVVRDAGAPRVPGFPYLRVDRFTASLGAAAGAGVLAGGARALRRGRQRKPKNAALPKLALNPCFPSHQLNQPACNMQS